MLLRLLTLSLLLLSCLVVCDSVANPRGQLPPDWPYAPPIWEECPENDSPLPGLKCANVTVPLNWINASSNPDDVIQVFVAKSPHTGTERQGTVWFLNGGTGVGGLCFMGKGNDRLISYYNSLGFDYVAPTFRGAAESTPSFYCPDDPNGQSLPSEKCLQFFAESYGPDYLSHFSMTQGSYDLAYLINNLSLQPTYLQGDSFGTWWLQRYLTIFPDPSPLVQSAVIESFITPDRWNYFEAFTNLDWAGKRVLSYCSEDIFCSTRAGQGKDATWALSTLMEEVAKGTLPCMKKLPAEIVSLGEGDWFVTFQFLFGGMTGASRENYALIPALLYRLRRCESQDIDAIIHYWKFLTGSTTSPQPKQTLNAPQCNPSNVILYNVFLSEGVQHPPPPSIETLKTTFRNRQLFSGPPRLLEESRALYDIWPRYAWDNYTHQYPNTSLPILFFNGDLDTSTPWDNAAYSSLAYNNPAQHLLRMPQVNHVAFLNSPTSNSPVPCGLEMSTKFFLAKGQSVDTSCMNYLLPLDWAAQTPAGKQASLTVFGTEDPWE